MLDPDISTRDAAPPPAPARAARSRTRSTADAFLQLVGMGVGAGLVAGRRGRACSTSSRSVTTPSAWAAGPVGSQRRHPRRHRHVRWQRRPEHGRAVQRRQLLHPARRARDRPAARRCRSPATRAAPGAHLAQGVLGPGQLAVVQGVGYPNPDLSHFNSMAYWMAGRPSARSRRPAGSGGGSTATSAGAPDLYAAAEVGLLAAAPPRRGQPQRGTVVPRAPLGLRGEHRAARPAHVPGDPLDVQPGATGRGRRPCRRRTSTSSTSPRRSRPSYPSTSSPEVDIVARLEVAARLINANLGFRVLTAGWGDFDSHANQPDMHPVAHGRAQRRRSPGSSRCSTRPGRAG